MPLNLKNKQEIITKIKNIANSALSIVFASSQRVTGNDITELRRLSRSNGVHISIIRNTLLNLAIKDTSFQCIHNSLHGPNLIAFSLEHAGSAARLLKEFSKTHKNFKITGGIFEEKKLSIAQIYELADMPTHNEAIIIFLSVIKEIAIGKLIRTLSAISNK
ncbi:50S ribosomal protein L10 [Buchnera aphidicola (Formosaphis micheliae)]|uniref:50S ribosomal protein L10 n=1 Tax=Buchnera aphidicola TaxID=9 RepID=UPI0031B83E10